MCFYVLGIIITHFSTAWVCLGLIKWGNKHQRVGEGLDKISTVSQTGIEKIYNKIYIYNFNITTSVVFSDWKEFQVRIYSQDKRKALKFIYSLQSPDIWKSTGVTSNDKNSHGAVSWSSHSVQIQMEFYTFILLFTSVSHYKMFLYLLKINIKINIHLFIFLTA